MTVRDLLPKLTPLAQNVMAQEFIVTRMAERRVIVLYADHLKLPKPSEVAQTICDLDMPVRRKYRIESEPNCPFELGAKAQRDADLKVLGKPQQWLDKPDKAGYWWRCTLTTGSQTVVQEVCESFAGLHVNTMGMSFPLEDVLKRNPKDKWQYIPEPEKPMEGKLELLK